MLRASCLASILAAARGFGSTPHAVENACRNKETPVAVSHAEMIADCVAAGISEMECTAELAEMQTADSVGCGAKPIQRMTYSTGTGGSAPSALCDCCPVEVGESEHKAALCSIAEVAETCTFTCTGSGDDNIVSLAQKIAIRKYKAEVLDGGASDTTTNFCGLVGKTYNWPCANPAGRRLFDAAPAAAPAMSCEDAADDAVAALIAELALPYANCAELQAAGECDRAIVKKHCPASCGSCACEDAADELVAKITREVFGRAVASCAALRSIREDFGGAGGACDHELAVKYCPASCGRCDVEAPSDRHGGGRQLKCEPVTSG